jgi:hypothetical protein
MGGHNAKLKISKALRKYKETSLRDSHNEYNACSMKFQQGINPIYPFYSRLRGLRPPNQLLNSLDIICALVWLDVLFSG